jgi:hypothetical protein
MSQPTSAARRLRVLLAHVHSDATPPRINRVAANAPAAVAAKWLPMAFSPDVQAALSSGAPVVALELRVSAPPLTDDGVPDFNYHHLASI